MHTLYKLKEKDILFCGIRYFQLIVRGFISLFEFDIYVVNFLDKHGASWS